MSFSFLEARALGLTIDQLREQQAEKRNLDEESSQARRARAMAGHPADQAVKNIMLTTETAHNFHVSKRLEIIAAEVVVGMNIFKDILAGVRNVVGGRRGSLQAALGDIRIQALNELKQEAANVGADAVVGVHSDCQEIGATGSTMLFVIASGTAVKLSESGGWGSR